MGWLGTNYGIVAAIALGVLELASMIPGVGASGYVKFAVFVLKWFATKDPMPTDQPALDSKNVPMDPHK